LRKRYSIISMTTSCTRCPCPTVTETLTAVRFCRWSEVSGMINLKLSGKIVHMINNQIYRYYSFCWIKLELSHKRGKKYIPWVHLERDDKVTWKIVRVINKLYEYQSYSHLLRQSCRIQEKNIYYLSSSSHCVPLAYTVGKKGRKSMRSSYAFSLQVSWIFNAKQTSNTSSDKVASRSISLIREWSRGVGLGGSL